MAFRNLIGAFRSLFAKPRTSKNQIAIETDFLSHVTDWNDTRKSNNIVNTLLADKKAPVMRRIKIEDILAHDDFEGELSDKLLNDFKKQGVPVTPATRSMAAHAAHITVMETCREAWAKIPTYKAAKVEGKSETSVDHFDQHWRRFLDAHLLYRHMMLEFDEPLLSNMRSYLRENDDIDANGYRIPPQSEYYDSLAKKIDIDYLALAERLHKNISKRQP